MDNKKVCVWLEPDLYEYLDEARGEELKIPQFIRLILKQKMKSAVKKRKPRALMNGSDPFTSSAITSDMIPNDLKEYADLIIEWWAVRHRNKATCSTSVSERIFKKLLSFTPQTRKIALEKAIAGGWKDIYDIKQPYKPEEPQNNHPAQRIFTAERGFE
tara:strand:+ start:90 stop:566 length:477 start_codon:yes stop_codon:yes gene_type:complete